MQSRNSEMESDRSTQAAADEAEADELAADRSPRGSDRTGEVALVADFGAAALVRLSGGAG